MVLELVVIKSGVKAEGDENPLGEPADNALILKKNTKAVLWISGR